MKAFLHKYLLATLIACLAINVLFFLLRNNVNFNYTRYSSLSKLYPPKTSVGDLNKWTAYNNRFTAAEIQAGADILKSQIRIDTLQGEYEKAVAIAKWLKKMFGRQEGYPSAALENLSPLNQYKLLISQNGEKLWCSHYQAMFGFYCTLAGIKNRYVEAVPVEGEQKAGYHEVNEIYLSATRNWVLVDVTRNILSVKHQQKLLTAAGYYNQLAAGKKDTLVYQQYNDAEKLLRDSLTIPATDVYFNRHYALRYYYTMNLENVYSAKNKMKRYFLGNAWFEMYDPLRKHSNSLFRIRQVASLALSVLIVLSGYFFLVPKKRGSVQSKAG